MSRLEKVTGRAEAREAVVVEVLLGAVAVPAGSSVLVVDDPSDAIGSELEHRGAQVTRWWRMASRTHTATPWPEAGQYDAATVRLSKDKSAFEMAIHAVLSVLKPDAPLYVYGANDEGIKSVPRRLRDLCGELTVIEARRHARVLQAKRLGDGTLLREPLAAWARQETLDFKDQPIQHTVYPGVFAKGGLDAGTRALLEHIPTPPKGSLVLDFACGAGVIAGALRRREDSLQFQLIDADAVAAEAARANVPGALVRVGAGWSALPAYQRYDRIVSNPPIHDGKERDYSVLHRLIEGAPHRLTDDGELWLVLQSQVPAEEALWLSFDSVECVSSDGRFRVWCGRLPNREGVHETPRRRRSSA